MLLLGLLLVGASAVFTGLVIAGNRSGGPDYSVSVLGHHIATTNTMAAFLAGAALALVFCIGIAMTRAGGRRSRRRRADLRAARQEAREAAAERDTLASRMPAEQSFADDRMPVEGSDDTLVAPGESRRHGKHLFGQ